MNLNRDEIKMRCDFAKGQKYTFQDLQAEIAANHFATAHRLVHTLKGVAGLIKEDSLAGIALKMEQQLKNKKHPDAGDMATLECELNRVLTEIQESGIMEIYNHNTPPTLDEQTALFDKLQKLLTENDAACMTVLPEVAMIYETKVLVRQVENFEFANALTTLEVLREVLGV
jgi:HPt (histidine-containing phosphotransfer) domain-containing protein